jgi:hypothetical protein
MGISFQKVFKQAFEITKNNRFLWIFGLFLVLGNYPLFSFIFHGRNQQGLQQDRQQVTQWLDSNVLLSNVILVMILFLIFVLVILYFHAKAANTVAIKAIIDKQQTSFRRAAKAGGLFRGRLIGVSIFSIGLMLLQIIILGAPIIYLFLVGFAVRALVLLLLALIIFLTATVMIWLVDALAPIFVVVYDQKILESLKAAFLMVIRCWQRLLLFGFLLLCISLAALFLSIFAAGFIILLFVFLSFIFYDRGGLIIQTLLPLTGIIVASVVFLMAQAVLTVFQSASWILIFHELIKPEKLDEKALVESVADPEAV